ncbi:MAG: transposase [Solirubrobacterales bacterium]
MARSRFQSPDSLPGATNFSRHDDLLGSENVVRMVKSNRPLWNQLARECDLTVNWGRGREPGNWELAALAFVASGHVDIQPWLSSTNASLWRLCGFAGKPPYKRVWRRLREIESKHEAFQEAAGVLIRKAREHDPRVGAHIHIDSTEDETHAALIHDCELGSCPRDSRPGVRPIREHTERAREERQTESTLPPEAVARVHGEIVFENGRTFKRFKLGECWFKSLDTEAGVRLYERSRGGRRFWSGYRSVKLVDHFTGGVILAETHSASRQENDIFEDSYDRLVEITEKIPETVIGDKGFSTSNVFEKCSTNGTAPIFPWRKSNFAMVRHDRETHDRHGTPRCKHCGGPTDFKRFSPNDGRPRIWFDCMVGASPECARTQSMSCAADWRLLVPLWRTDPLYHELRQSHARFEGAHDYWRDRYKVGADTLANRPKMRGIGAHRLRSSVAMLIEWLRICTVEGWLGSERRNHREPTRSFRESALTATSNLLNMRARVGLHAAYGPKAAQLGLGDISPPSRR